MIHKSNKAYKSIGEVAKILNLVNKKKGTLNTHTIRFWEKEFKQIKPKILNGNRRYYNNETIETLKKVKYLLKDRYESINKIKNTNSPLLVLHGKLDNIVPFSMGLKLFEKANEPKFKYFIDNDDHMMRYDQKLLDELKKFITGIDNLL